MAMGNCLSQSCQKNNVDFYDIFNIYGVLFWITGILDELILESLKKNLPEIY